MKPKLIASAAACAAILATVCSVHAQDPAAQDLGGKKTRHRWGNGLEHMTETLELTPEQQARVHSIVEKARPQIAAIRQESRQKIQAIRDNVRAQIRPLLTPAQQQKLDAIHKAREAMRKARQEMHELASGSR